MCVTIYTLSCCIFFSMLRVRRNSTVLSPSRVAQILIIFVSCAGCVYIYITVAILLAHGPSISLRRPKAPMVVPSLRVLEFML